LLNTMSLVWGVRGYYYNNYVSTDETIKEIKEFLKKNNLVGTDDLIINIASIPMEEKGRANMLKLSYIS
ncbi:MAG: pyruvate kinase alpha/beta domain-containing protein, partial [Bacteroidota bacterium]